MCACTCTACCQKNRSLPGQYLLRGSLSDRLAQLLICNVHVCLYLVFCNNNGGLSRHYLLRALFHLLGVKCSCILLLFLGPQVVFALMFHLLGVKCSCILLLFLRPQVVFALKVSGELQLYLVVCFFVLFFAT